MQPERARAYRLVLTAYALAIGVGAVLLVLVPGGPLLRAFVADVAATVVIFAFSRAYGNSSFYDPYWSVIPPLLAVYWMLAAGGVGAPAVLAFVLVCLWAARLTGNWLTYWSSLDHEDWRYTKLREDNPNSWFFVDFAGIHMFPTIQVFLGCLPLYAVILYGTPGLGWLDALAAAVMLAGIALEFFADRQLHAFLARRQSGEFIRSGLWAWSRHPNYLGELLFWYGLMIFGLAAHPAGWWWLILGALAMTGMFVFVSVPMMDRRNVERRPGYAEFMKEVPMLLPKPPGRS